MVRERLEQAGVVLVESLAAVTAAEQECTVYPTTSSSAAMSIDSVIDALAPMTRSTVSTDTGSSRTD